VQVDRVDVLSRVFQAICRSDTTAAREILRIEYPFFSISRQDRRYREIESLSAFRRDGFIDRYSGQRLIFPGTLRLLSRLLPQEFPFNPNWKMAETHRAYWELFPTIDHVIPVTRGGSDTDENWIPTSMLRNAAKANWTLQELGWTLCPGVSLAEWDGLMSLFVDFVGANRSLLRDSYIRRWHHTAVWNSANAE
jgi:hypothetical protein